MVAKQFKEYISEQLHQLYKGMSMDMKKWLIFVWVEEGALHTTTM